MAEDGNIDVRIQFITAGQKTVDSAVKSIQSQLKNLTRTNMSLTATTGQLLPQFAQQATLINSLSDSTSKYAKNLVTLRQEGSLFNKIFSGETKKNLAELQGQFGNFGGMTRRVGQELKMLSVVTDGANAKFRSLTAPERIKIMGNVFASEMKNMTNHLINFGKQAQWVGRQMIVGLTLPIAFALKQMTMSWLTLNKAQTEFQKYLIQNGYSIQQAAAMFDSSNLDSVAVAFEDIAIKTGMYTDEVTNLGAAWLAAGYDVSQGLVELTNLTAELNLLSQGEIDQASSIELIRSVQASWKLETEETTQEIKQLNLIAGTTSLTLGEIAESLPVVSSNASILNITASELAATLAGMREQGVSASQAANSLKFSINRMINPTEKAKETWEAMTKLPPLKNILFDEQGVGRGIQGLQDMADAFKDLTGEESATLAGQLFGGYRADRMLKMIDSMNDINSQFAKSIENISDTQEAVAAWEKQLQLIRDSDIQAFKVLKVEFIAVMQKLGQVAFPYLEKLGRVLIDLLEAFEESPAYIKKFALGIAGLLAGIGPVIFVTSMLVEALGTLGRAFTEIPLQIFKFNAHADPFGLRDLAAGAGKKNPLIQILAGLPMAQEEMAAMATKSQVGIYSVIEALRQEGIAVDKLTADYIKLNIMRQGGFNGPTNFMTTADELAGLADARRAVVRDSGIRRLANGSFLGSGPSGSGFLSKDSIRKLLGFADMAGVDEVFDDISRDIARSNGLRKLQNGSFMLNNRFVSKEAVARLVGVDVASLPRVFADYSDEVATGLATATAAGITSATNDPAITNASKTFKDRLKGMWTGFSQFMSGGKTKIAGAGSGSMGATIFQAVFGSPAKILAILGIVAVALLNIKSIMKGLEKPLATVSAIWKDFIKFVGDKISSSLNKNSEAFEAIGHSIGDLIASLSELITTILKPLISILVDVGVAVSAVVAAITKLFQLDGAGFWEVVNNLSIFQKILAAIVAGGLLFKLVNTLRVLAIALPNAFRLAVTGITGVKVAATGLQAVLAGIGTFGIGTIITAATIAIPLLIDMFSTKDLAMELAHEIGEADKALVDFNNEVKKGADVSAEVIDPLMQSFDDYVKGISENTDIGESVDYWESEIERLQGRIDELVSDNGGITPQLARSTEFSQLSQRINEIKTEIIPEAQRISQDMDREVEHIAKNLTNKLYADEMKAVLDNINDKIRYYQILAETSIDDATVKNAEQELQFWNKLKQALHDYGNVSNSELMSAARDFDNLRAKMQGVTTATRKMSEEMREAYADQIQQLASRVQDAMLEEFDENAEDRMDALEEQSERRMEIFDEEAEAQVEAIDKKIEAIDKENEKEDWLRQQQEWRRERAKIMQDMELADAMAFRERMKAIHEGRFDDARLIELQALSDRNEFNDQLKDLDREEREGRESRKDDKRRERLEKEKELLQERLDAQREALQDQLDAQKEALEEQLDNQRTFLENMLEELNEFAPKNKKQWERHWAQLQRLAKDNGISIDGIYEQYSQAWGQSIKEGLQDAAYDAARIAGEIGYNINNGISHKVADAKKEAINPKDIALYKVMAEFLRDQASGKLDTPQKLAAALQNISQAMVGVSKEAEKNASPYYFPGPLAGQMAQGRGPGYFHSGDMVSGSPGSDVPAVLQEGEFVVQRGAVRKYGARGLNLLRRFNKMKLPDHAEYHTGGLVLPFVNSVASSAIASSMNLFNQSSFTTGLITNMASLLGQNIAGSILSSAGGAPVSSTGSLLPPTSGQVWSPGLASGKFPAFEQEMYPKSYMYQAASRLGTPAARAFLAAAREVFPGFASVFAFNDYARRGYNGASGPPWSQHSWGNAVDINISTAMNDALANWAYQNRDALNIRDIIWREPNHDVGDNPHVHVEFWPAADDMWNPPMLHKGGFVGHKGGVFGPNGFKRFGNLQFEAPALLKYGETVLPNNISNALNTIGQVASGGGGGVTIEVNIQGDLYGDESSYRRLADTLERVGNKIARERGLGDNSVVRVGGF